LNRTAAAAFALLLAACGRHDPFDDPGYAAECHGPPLRSIEERQQAFEAGYAVSVRYDCIEKKSWEEVQKAHAMVASMVAEAEKQVAAQKALEARGLAIARQAFKTTFGEPASGEPLPTPPSALFIRADYTGGEGRTLAAFISPDPGDGQRHPAIVWITGGDSSTLGDFWTEGSAADDQSASAFRKAGMVMMFPTLRGGNTDTGKREFFYGEVDDIHAAAKYLAKLSFVDPSQVYLGGHSTGGTLALLTAETGGDFAAVFAFGPVGSVNRYPPEIFPGNPGLDEREIRLRSPLHWLNAIATPTYLIEGSESPGNSAELETLCSKAENHFVHCVPVPGKNHFSVLDAVSRKLAARIVTGGSGDKPLVRAEEFGGGAGSATAAP
jgi:acetyl esterase/lipase